MSTQNLAAFAEAGAEDFDIYRQVMAFSTADSWGNVPHVSYIYEPDVTDFMIFYDASLRSSPEHPQRITLNTVFLKIIADAITCSPRLNSLFSYSSFSCKGRLEPQPHVNITLPTLLDSGKVVSLVVHGVEARSIAALQEDINGLKERAGRSDIVEVLSRTAKRDTIEKLKHGESTGFKRLLALVLGVNRLVLLKGRRRRDYYAIAEAERLTERDIREGTVVVSNIGSIGAGLPGQFTLLDVIEPQVFAIGIGAVSERPAVYARSDGERAIGIRKVLPFCFCFDHRAFEFSTLLPFLRRLEELFAHPELVAEL